MVIDDKWLFPYYVTLESGLLSQPQPLAPNKYSDNDDMNLTNNTVDKLRQKNKGVQWSAGV